MATSDSVNKLVAAWNQEKQDIADISTKLTAALAAQQVAIDADDEATIESTTADMTALHAQLTAVANTPPPAATP